MESKNYWFVGVLLVILVGGIIVWGLQKEPEVAAVNDNSIQQSGNALMPNADDIKAAEAVYTRAQTASASNRFLEGGKYVTVVNYGGDTAGFSPQITFVNRGENIRFVNKSADAMRISSVFFNGTPSYPTLTQDKSVGRNESYSFSITTAGVWSYYNMNDADGPVGVVYVR